MTRILSMALFGALIFGTYDYLAENGRNSKILFSKAGAYVTSFQGGVSTSVFSGLSTSAAHAAGALASAVGR